jgi:predicted outer membrane repeat protein
MLEQRHLLATFTVLNNGDAGAGSLRDALAMADAAAGADVIEFAAALNGATIALTTGELAINDPVTINGLGAANLRIDAADGSRIFNLGEEAGDVSIKGLALSNGATLGSGGAVYSSSLGLLTIADSTITDSGALGSGGGIFASGDLLLTNTTVGGVGALGNQAGIYGGGVYGNGTITLKSSTISGNLAGAGGGGVYGTGKVSLDNSTVGGTAAGTGNTAATYGGGIYAVDVDVLNSTISGNVATGQAGGGIYARGSVAVKSSTVSGNTAGSNGGGIYTFNGSISLQNSTIGGSAAGTGNTAASDGGGVFGRTVNVVGSTIAGNEATSAGGGDGGGIYARKTATLRNSTISGNRSGQHGGGIYGPSVTLQNVTVANNTADFDAGVMGLGGGVYALTTFKMQNSIVAGNSDTGNGNPDLKVPLGAGSQVKFSLISDNTGAVNVGGAPGAAGMPNGQGNFIGTGGTPITLAEAFGAGGGALANNGGFTETIELKAGSLVINKGKNTLVVSPGQGDQRGLPFVRIFGGTVDMGAFESQPPVPANTPPVVANPIPNQTAIVDAPFVFTFAANTFTDANNNPLTYTAALNGGGALPAWLTFTQGTAARTFVGVPTAADVGVLNIQVTASDGMGGLTTTNFTLTVIAAELPFTEDFNNPVIDPRIVQQTPTVVRSAIAPIEGAGSLQATRGMVNSRPLATLNFAPATAANITNVSVNVSTDPGNGSTLWSNAVIAFDYQSPTNYKFAGVFEIIDRLIIGQVVNGRVQYLSQAVFPAASNTTIPLNLAINRTTRQVTLNSGATNTSFTFATLGTGTIGLGTINANAKFDQLSVS